MRSSGWRGKGSNRKRLIRSVGAESFAIDVLGEKKPVLVVCMQRDSEFQGQIDIVEDICRSYGGRLKACLILEEEITEVIREKVGIRGTPTFVVFLQGIEQGRMLGHVEGRALREFLSRTVPLDRSGSV